MTETTTEKLHQLAQAPCNECKGQGGWYILCGLYDVEPEQCTDCNGAGLLFHDLRKVCPCLRSILRNKHGESPSETAPCDTCLGRQEQHGSWCEVCVFSDQGRFYVLPDKKDCIAILEQKLTEAGNWSLDYTERLYAYFLPDLPTEKRWHPGPTRLDALIDAVAAAYKVELTTQTRTKGQ